MIPMCRLLVCSIGLWLPIVSHAAIGDCGTRAIPIHQIQGHKARSPLKGQQVTVEGVVTMVAQDRKQLKGFFLQQATAEVDRDPRTSEGVFVYHSATPVQQGQRVRLQGTVTEFHQLTEIKAVTALKHCGTAPLPEPVLIQLPVAAMANWEALEGMRVTLQGPIQVVNHYQLRRYGQIGVSRQRHWHWLQQHQPDAQAFKQWQQQAQRDYLTIDDPSHAQFVEPVWLLGTQPTLRIGSQLKPITGVLSYGFGAYRLHAAQPLRIETAAPRPEWPQTPKQDAMLIMSLNAHNLMNGNGKGGGFDKRRGPANRSEWQHQLQQLTQLLLHLQPQLIALNEVENDGFGPDAALAQLVTQLNQSQNKRFAMITVPLSDSGSDQIRNALIYDTTQLVTLGDTATLLSGEFARRHRPPVLQTFADLQSGMRFTVVVNHLKSKGGCPKQGENADQRDGQGCWAAARLAAVQQLQRWLQQQDALQRVLLLGDFNSYPNEQSMRWLAQQGWQDVAQHVEPMAYSYQFQQWTGRLDYGWVSTDLLPSVIQMQYWPINADEPDLPIMRDHTAAEGIPPYRSSDHDPLLIWLSRE